MFQVKVPHCVPIGRTFDAVRVQDPEPIIGQFSDGLCSCTGEGFFFLWACFCPVVAFAVLMEKLNLNVCGRPRQRPPSSPSRTFAIVTFIWIVFYISYKIWFVNRVIQTTNQYAQPSSATATVDSTADVVALVSIVCHIGWVYFVVVQTQTRMAVREKYGIHGHCICDCLTTTYCGCCSVLQMHRHMKKTN